MEDNKMFYGKREIYLYEDEEQYMGDIRDFFEGIDMSSLNIADKIKLVILKDMWATYYATCVSSDPSIDLAILTVSLLVMANSIEDEDVKGDILDFTYDFVHKLEDEVEWSPCTNEEIDKMLVEAGLIKINAYYKMKKQLKRALNKNIQKKD